MNALALGALARPALADTFVLVVANNRSLRTHLPDLQYADDDAIRYYQLLGALLPGARLERCAALVRPESSFSARLAAERYPMGAHSVRATGSAGGHLF